MKNKELRELLKREEMMPFFDIESLRQKLLKIRYTNPDLLAEKIPMTEEDIANNQKLLDLLEVNKNNFPFPKKNLKQFDIFSRNVTEKLTA